MHNIDVSGNQYGKSATYHPQDQPLRSHGYAPKIKQHTTNTAAQVNRIKTSQCLIYCDSSPYRTLLPKGMINHETVPDQQMRLPHTSQAPLPKSSSYTRPQPYILPNVPRSGLNLVDRTRPRVSSTLWKFDITKSLGVKQDQAARRAGRAAFESFLQHDTTHEALDPFHTLPPLKLETSRIPRSSSVAFGLHPSPATLIFNQVSRRAEFVPPIPPIQSTP